MSNQQNNGQVTSERLFSRVNGHWITLFSVIIVLVTGLSVGPAVGQVATLRTLTHKETVAAQKARDHADLMRAGFESRYRWKPGKDSKPILDYDKAEFGQVEAAYQLVIKQYNGTEIAAYSSIRLVGLYKYIHDYEKARLLNIQTANQYHGTTQEVKALFELGLMYLQTYHDPAEAIKWFDLIKIPTDVEVVTQELYNEVEVKYLSVQQLMARCEIMLGLGACAEIRYKRLTARYPHSKANFERELEWEKKSELGRLESQYSKKEVLEKGEELLSRNCQTIDMADYEAELIAKIQTQRASLRKSNKIEIDSLANLETLKQNNTTESELRRMLMDQIALGSQTQELSAFSKLIHNRPIPDIARLAQRSLPSAEYDDGESFYDILKIREEKIEKAMPVLAEIMESNSQTGRIHYFAAAQALFCIGTPEACEILDKHLLTPNYGIESGIKYAFSWEMSEIERRAFIKQYHLRNLAQDLALELEVNARHDQQDTRLDCRLRLRNTSDKTYRIYKRQVYLGKMLYFQDEIGRTIRPLEYVDYNMPMPIWLELKPGDTHTYTFAADVKPPPENQFSKHFYSADSKIVAITKDVVFDLRHEGRFIIQALIEAPPLTETQRQYLVQTEGFDNVWSGRAVSAPQNINVFLLNQQSWGEPLNGLRMRVSAPAETEYRQGKSLPLLLEIQNISHQPIPLNKLFNPLSFKVTDQDNNRIGIQGYLYNHIIRWEGAAENLEPGEIINDTVYFEKLRFKLPPGRESVTLHFQLPTQKENPGKLPINCYSNPITIQLKDNPFEHPLTSQDLPETWTEEMDIIYREGGSIWGGEMGLHIDGKGHVTTVAWGWEGRHGEAPFPNGRHEYVLQREDLNELLRQLREFKIERLNPYDRKMYATDLLHVYLSVARDGKTMGGNYELYAPETKPVFEFQEIMRNLIRKLVAEKDLIEATPPLVNEGKYSWQQKGAEKIIWLHQDTTDADLKALSGQKDITSLQMGGMSPAAGPLITDEGLRHLRGCLGLKVLNMSGLKMITDDGLQYIAGLKNLEVLQLCDTKITDQGLMHLKNLENLRELWLDFLPFTDAGTVHLKGLNKLRVLRFFGAAITDAGMENFRNMSELEDLQLGNSLITDKSMPIIGNMTRLKTLDLRTKVTDNGLLHLKQLTELSWLCLSDTVVGDKGMDVVGERSGLEWLFLENTKITDAGLIKLEGLAKLQSLYLTKTNITDLGLSSVAKLKELENLKLNETPISDEGLRKLHALKQLKHLELYKTRASQKGIDQLKKAIPGITVITYKNY